MPRTTRPSSPEKFTASQHISKRGQSGILDWKEDEVPGRDVTRRETLLLLAKMTGNSYFVPGSSEWYNLTEKWNVALLLVSACCCPAFLRTSFPRMVCQLGGSPTMTAFGVTRLQQKTTAVVLMIKGTSNRSSAVGLLSRRTS